MLDLRSAPLPGPAPAANTTASAPAIALRDLVDRGLLQVAHDRLAAVGAQVVLVRRVADQPADPVAARDEQPRQPPRDLPVSTCDHDVHSIGEDCCILARLVGSLVAVVLLVGAAAVQVTDARPLERGLGAAAAKSGPLVTRDGIRRARRFAGRGRERSRSRSSTGSTGHAGLRRTAHFPSASVSKAMLLVAVLRRSGQPAA